jgi:hypothetical protein
MNEIHATRALPLPLAHIVAKRRLHAVLVHIAQRLRENARGLLDDEYLRILVENPYTPQTIFGAAFPANTSTFLPLR